MGRGGEFLTEGSFVATTVVGLYWVQSVCLNWVRWVSLMVPQAGTFAVVLRPAVGVLAENRIERRQSI